MLSSRASFRLALAGLLVGAAGVLGWLLLGFAGDRTGMVEFHGGAPVVEFLEDATGQSTHADVMRLPPGAWQRWPGEGFLWADQRGALWLRLTLRNPGETEQHGVLTNRDYYFVDEVEAWTSLRRLGSDGPILPAAAWQHQRTGEAVPVRLKPLWGRDCALPIVVPARSECVVYVRSRDFFRAVFWPVWWPDVSAFHSARARGWLAEGIYFGLLFALLGYNAVLWLRLRSRDIGFYVLYLGTAALFMVLARAQLQNLGWALGSPGLDAVLFATGGLSGVFLTQFARVFLELPARSPRGDRVVRGLAAVLLALSLVTLVTPWLRGNAWPTLLLVLATGVTHLSLLTVAIQAWRAGLRPARFFVLSFGCLFAGSVPTVALSVGHSPWRDEAIMGLMVGSALEMMLLSLAVADRFAQAQRDKTAAQARLVEETEQRRAIEEAYADELAVEVRERTRELEAANADKDRMLTVVGHDLRGPLTALTQAAEQAATPPTDFAALGKFTGEAAVVGRQVLLLIEDLVLWARLRAGRMLPPGRHRVAAIVAPVAALHRAFAGQRGIKLIVAVADDLRVLTDLVLAQTLLRNLVANALKFARAEVTVSAQRTADGVQLTVSDDGPGLPAAVLAALASETSLPGADSGLGLRLCVEIGRALGAQLGAVSIAGAGTEFKFVLPAAGNETDAPP